MEGRERERGGEESESVTKDNGYTKKPSNKLSGGQIERLEANLHAGEC